ncbi:MAG TPA: hypothetical protein VI968_04135 [archaeon]|nr:hypothetical protein [archaeon]
MSTSGVSVSTDASGAPMQCTAKYGSTSYVYSRSGDTFRYEILHNGKPVNSHVLDKSDLSPAVRKAFRCG